jgi:transcriptional regulator GlxA family with amidase domain
LSITVAGTGSRSSRRLLDLDAESDRIQKHLSGPLSVQALARVAFLSLRQFSRLFREETEQSPAKAIERPRVVSLRLMREAGRFSAEEGRTVLETASGCGVRSSGHSDGLHKQFNAQ